MAATNAGFGKTAEHPSLSSAGLKAISTDIFAHLLERQVPQQAQFNALFATAVGAARFPFGSKRATYIGWIFQLSSRLGFGPDTGASAVVLMDRTLLVLGRACPRLPEDGIELMCVGCLWIIAKMEEKEVDIPTLTYLIEVSGITRIESAVPHELRSMEMIVLQASEWNACVISPTHFVPHYKDLIGELIFGPEKQDDPTSEACRAASNAAGDFAFQLIRLALVGAPLKCLPSMMGVVAVITGFEMARLPVWDQWPRIRAAAGIDSIAAEEAFSLCYQDIGRMAHRLIKVHKGPSKGDDVVSFHPFAAAAKAGLRGLPSSPTAIDRKPPSEMRYGSPKSPPHTLKTPTAAGGGAAAGKRRVLPLSPDSPGSPSKDVMIGFDALDLGETEDFINV